MKTAASKRKRRRWALGALAPIAALAILVPTALAELTQHGNLFIRFDGGISPRALPRHELSPIGVRIEGTVRTPPGVRRPKLRTITVAVNRAGKLTTVGLPKCRRKRIEASGPSQALNACGPALVGSGGIVARTSIEDQVPSTARGEILLFNAIDRGHPAVLAHVHQTQPIPLTRIFTMKIRRKRGTFGTVISGSLPKGLNEKGYIKSIFLNLERRYRYRGRQRSYLSAACSAPAGFDIATFPFAKASMTFEGGRTLRSTLVRSCRVR